jgi:fumarate reductase flavoprotein subunit
MKKKRSQGSVLSGEIKRCGSGPKRGLYWQQAASGAILVNRRGERFINESMGHKDIGLAVLGQPGSVGFQLFDQKIYSNVMTKGGFVGVRLDKIAALAVNAGTIEELASKIGVPSGALKETVQRYNHHADKGKDRDFGRTTKVGGIGTIARIDSPPFYAYESKGMLPGTYAGIVVDENMRVLNAHGIVKGLYAAGELVGGFHGASYMTGTALAKAIIFGRIAGRHAARANFDYVNRLPEQMPRI